MKIAQYQASQAETVIELFANVFSDSEGADEGQVIATLVDDLITTTDSNDLIGFVATENEFVIGCIFFSRLVTANNANAFILSPVAINTENQGQGIGQKLILEGLSYLKATGVERVFSYGDPNYYNKVGFKQINDAIITAPFTLTYPEGWIAQTLNEVEISKQDSVISCVDALNKQKYW
ncbi:MULTISPECIES: GNAT family N-acetyltransferase [Shewanella]|uniref:GNAT family N-acetyltransferase n=1 Tax=Shewanella TaxID=22 RepID=UPI000E7195AE|nr:MULTISPECIES: N-acetyltransferase [Shewanella]